MNSCPTNQMDVLFFFFGALQIIKGVDRGNVVDVICSRFQKAHLCLMKSYEKMSFKLAWRRELSSRLKAGL